MAGGYEGCQGNWPVHQGGRFRVAEVQEMMLPRDCYIGFDEREPKSYVVTDYSMGRRSSIPLRTKMLDQKTLRSIGLYDRPFRQEGLTRIDERDGKPFSTDFSFTRFLVPALSLYE